MNEPVAWMYEKSNGASKLSFVKEKMLWEDMTETPLYTHPVKELTLTHEEYDNIFANGKRLGVIETENRLWKAMQLTDAEITELANEYLCYISHEYEVTGIYKFARAILRKAQEK